MSCPVCLSKCWFKGNKISSEAHSELFGSCCLKVGSSGCETKPTNRVFSKGFDIDPSANHLLVCWDSETNLLNNPHWHTVCKICALASAMSSCWIFDVLFNWSVWFYWLTLNPSHQPHHRLCLDQIPARTRPSIIMVIELWGKMRLLNDLRSVIEIELIMQQVAWVIAKRSWFDESLNWGWRHPHTSLDFNKLESDTQYTLLLTGMSLCFQSQLSAISLCMSIYWPVK